MRLSEIDPEKITPGSKQLLTPDIDPDADLNKQEQEKAEYVAEYIKKHCSDILDLYRSNGSVFYRGTKSPSYDSYAFVSQSRQDRRPKDSGRNTTIYFDNVLSSAGFTALRSNSIFITSRIGQAESYGDVFVVFPFNGFTYTYTNRNDVIIHSESLTYYSPELIPLLSEWASEQPVVDQEYGRLNVKFLQDMLVKAQKNSDEKSWDLLDSSGIKLPTEGIALYLHAMSTLLGYAIGIYQKTGDKRFEKFKDSDPKAYWDPKAVMEYYRPRKTNLNTPLTDGREVFMNCKYVAVENWHRGKINSILGLK
jgi:hypothetical protein